MNAELLKEDEYLDPETGRILCKTCRKPRRIRIPDGDGGMRLVPVLCDCGRKARDLPYAEMKKKEQLYKIQRNRDIGMQEPALRTYTFQNDRFHQPQMKIAEKYAAQFDAMAKEAQGLIFWGNVGTGKTYLAACIGNALLDREKTVMMTNFTRIINGLSDFKTGNALMDELGTYDLLILDDLGTENCNAYTMERIYSAVDTRYRSQKPMILTTNLSLKELKNPDTREKERIYSRILQRCIPVCVSGENLRQQQALENVAAAREKLQA